MQLDVSRSDLHEVGTVSRPPEPLAPGEARLRIDAFGPYADNIITCGVYGDQRGRHPHAGRTVGSPE